MPLALFLFMLGVGANHHNGAAPFNHFAFFTNGLGRSTNFHYCNLLLRHI